MTTLALLASCHRPETSAPDHPDARGHVAATAETVRRNAAVAEDLPLDDPQSFEDAQRGFLASDDPLVVAGPSGAPVWDRPAYDFVEGDAPPTVNPSLWRQEKLNGAHGLFRVTDRIYQVRGYDLSNMSVIEGDRGHILVDPLTSVETARKALALVERTLGHRPIVAVIVTHSHIDHFGGVKGVVSEDDLRAGRVRLIAPKDLVEEAVSENVLAGTVMGRRSVYMYGIPLERAPRGHVGSGLGKAPALGTVSLLPPTDVVDHTGQTMDVDGVHFVFQYVPHSEAPTELTFHLPQLHAFCGAEIVTQTMHNLYTLRGAKVRDALLWSGYIDEALRLFGDDTEVVFESHHWPVWGRERVRAYLEKQRDVYAYIHDQTLRLASQGMTPDEIAETLVLPASLRRTFAVRGYYGTTRHNAKAVYQYYFGWFDGDPAHLDPLPPADAGRRYVEAMGGAGAVLAKARAAHEQGDDRWAATLLDHLVFAEPGNEDAKALLARVYDQLGYQAESGPWRDVYLTGAEELRHGVQRRDLLAQAGDIMANIPLDMFFSAMATRLDGPRADGKEMTLNFTFRDVGQTIVAQVKNAVLHHRPAPPDPDADATITLTRELWLRLVSRQASLKDLLFSDDFQVHGSRLTVLAFFRLLDQPDGNFPIVTP